MPAFDFWLALAALLGNVLVVTPVMMLLGFSLAGVVNADVKAFHEIGKRGKVPVTTRNSFLACFWGLFLAVTTTCYHLLQFIFGCNLRL
jgi:hypothetical protein